MSVLHKHEKKWLVPATKIELKMKRQRSSESLFQSFVDTKFCRAVLRQLLQHRQHNLFDHAKPHTDIRKAQYKRKRTTWLPWKRTPKCLVKSRVTLKCSDVDSFRSVVVITCALHAQGPRFEPGRKQACIFLYAISAPGAQNSVSYLLHWHVL